MAPRSSWAFLIVAFFLAVSAIANCPKPNDDGSCSGQHCSARSVKVNKMCQDMWARANGGPVLPSVFVECEPYDYCHCKCSCPVGDTPVQVPNGWMNIKQIRPGDRVMVLDNKHQWTSREVKFSDGSAGTDGAVIPNMIHVKTSKGHRLIVTADHPFVVAGWTIKPAIHLTAADKLIDAQDLQPVPVESVTIGTYRGAIWNIATSPSSAGPGEPLEDHMINTAGVVSGDYYAELFLSPPVAATGLPSLSHMLASPSKAAAIHDADFVPAMLFKDMLKTIAGSGTKKHVVSFLPESSEEAADGMLKSSITSVGLEEADYLAFQFSQFYPDIVMHVRDYWHDNTVNAYAWREGSKEHVALLGGLIRHTMVSSSGLAIVLAHEIGHHRGGKPRYSNGWASCEGQADYWGAMVPMRKVFWGPESIRRIRTGADELYNLFSNGLKVAPVGAAELCGHPPPACRKETYLAAARLDEKPACAGAPPESTDADKLKLYNPTAHHDEL